MTKTIRDLFLLTVISLLLTALIWLPHLLKIPSLYGLSFTNGFDTIYRNFDGLEYVVIAKSWYEPGLLALVPQPFPATYYASHFPGYSLGIWLLGPVVGYLRSMLLVALTFTILSVWAFYFLLKELHKLQLVWLSTLFLVLPARWLIVHSIGSSEPMFAFLVLASLYFFIKFERLEKSYFIWASALFGMGAQLTRPPGILVFVALILYIHWKLYLEQRHFGIKKAILRHLRYWPLVLFPASLLMVFLWYNQALGDFTAYFHSGDNIHLSFLPFQVFNKTQPWVGEIWLEDVIYIYILGLLGGLVLLKQKLYPLGFFVLTYMVAVLFIAHRDVARYSLPIFPFLIIAFENVLVKKEFKIVMVVIALGVYLYAQNFILNNTAPIPNIGLYN